MRAYIRLKRDNTLEKWYSGLEFGMNTLFSVKLYEKLIFLSFFCLMIHSFYEIWGEIIGLQDHKLVQKVYISKTKIGKVGSRLLSKVRFQFFFLSHRTTNFQVTKIYIWETFPLLELLTVHCDWKFSLALMYFILGEFPQSLIWGFFCSNRQYLGEIVPCVHAIIFIYTVWDKASSKRANQGFVWLADFIMH
jgi:hypothetical protein